MSTKSNGGPAFPQHGWSSDPAVVARMQDQGGMTLRDYFAVRAPSMNTPTVEVAEALVGRKMPQSQMGRELFWLDVDAEQRYLWAEAMLRARKDDE